MTVIKDCSIIMLDHDANNMNEAATEAREAPAKKKAVKKVA